MGGLIIPQFTVLLFFAGLLYCSSVLREFKTIKRVSA